MDNIWLKTSHFLTEVEHSIKDDLAQTALNGYPITSIYVLAALYERDEQRASDLAKAVGAAATAFTPTLDRLERAELITRKPHPTDRRAILVSLTREGKKLQTVVVNALGNAEVRYGGK